MVCMVSPNLKQLWWCKQLGREEKHKEKWWEDGNRHHRGEREVEAQVCGHTKKERITSALHSRCISS